jgi:hypothetical protein
MDDRIVQFIAGLRAAGVRVSLAESQDAALAVLSTGVHERRTFQAALRTTLIKDHADAAVFNELFPLYFSAGAPPLTSVSDVLTPDERQLLRAALQALAGDIQELLRRMLQGMRPSEEEVQAALESSGLNRARGLNDRRRLSRRVQRSVGMDDLMRQIEALLDKLAELGMSLEAQRRLKQALLDNAGSLERQIDQLVGSGLAERLAQDQPDPTREDRLLERPFEDLSPDEADALRKQVTRMASRLRTRSALRMRRGKGHELDVKATLRRDLRTNGVPFEIIHRRHRLKSRFTILCDVSTSMRPTVEFLLLLVYQLQDQVSRTRSFAYIDHIEEISAAFDAQRPEYAIPEVLQRMPPGHYNTDLGCSLEQFVHDHLDAVDRRTTLIVCSDGRNNYNDPRFDLIERLARRARQTVWFDPEPPDRWALGDSDMPGYIPHVNAVHQVSNLRQLGEAVDQLLA